jgi:hypothetical protein
VGQARDASAGGAALFACPAAGVREILMSRAAFVPAFVVGDGPHLRPLAAMLGEHPAALVAFVDGERARLIPLTPEGGGEEMVLESAVPGQHRRGGWAQLAQSRYSRHIEQHRGEHYDAVLEALAAVTEDRQARWVVLAGASGTLAALRDRLPAALQAAVIGTVPAAWHESAAAITARADELMRRVEVESARQAVAQALTDAAKGQRAVTGVDDTLAAASRGAIHRLLILQRFAETGRACTECGGAQPPRGHGVSHVSRTHTFRGSGRRGGGSGSCLRRDGHCGDRRQPVGKRRWHSRDPALPALTAGAP